MINIRLLILSIVLIFPQNSTGQSTHFSVFDSNRDKHTAWLKYSNNGLSLYNNIFSEVTSFLNQREKIIESLNYREDWESYTREIRQQVFSRVDQFQKTPLNATVTGTTRKDDYTIDKIIFESHPGFFVSACLFIPKNSTEPMPCIIYCSGHSELAFRDSIYQKVILNLAKKGFAVFAFDPLGQGERLQYNNKQYNQSLIGGPTSEHSYLGAQNLLKGESLISYMIWDGVRAVDFLLSRPDIDHSKIGITGRSGGGTQSAFIAAYDKRISAAAPECYITNYQRLFESIGPQDAEQNPYMAIKKGFNHADLLHLIAPRPLLIVTTTNDFFSIQGARETFKEAMKSYKVFDALNKIKMVENIGIHESTQSNREALYAFFQNYLGNDGPNKEEKISCLSYEELQVTPTGQVTSSYNSKTVFDLLQIQTDSIINARHIITPNDLLNNRHFIEDKAQELSGFKRSRGIKSVVYTGRIKQEAYFIEKYFIQGKDFNYPIPFVLIKPLSCQTHSLLLYIDPSGKENLLNNSDEILSYIKKGYSILAPDLIGTGELSNTSYKGDSFIQGNSYNILFGANLAGTSIAGMQASDLDVLFEHILTRKDIDTSNIVTLVSGEICSAFLHFAIHNKRLNNSILVNPQISYEDILRTRYYNPKYVLNAVPGAIQYYDLPYLLAILSPSELSIINPVNSKGEVDTSGFFDLQYSFIKKTYQLKGEKKHFKLKILNESDVSNCILNLM